jgi:hypothetical protein
MQAAPPAGADASALDICCALPDKPDEHAPIPDGTRERAARRARPSSVLIVKARESRRLTVMSEGHTMLSAAREATRCSSTPLHQLLGYKEEADAPEALRELAKLLDVKEQQARVTAAQSSDTRDDASLSLAESLTYLDVHSLHSFRERHRFREESKKWSNTMRAFAPSMGLRSLGAAASRWRRTSKGENDPTAAARVALPRWFAELEARVAAGGCTGAQFAVRFAGGASSAAASLAGSSEARPPPPLDGAVGHVRPGERMSCLHMANWMSTTTAHTVHALSSTLHAIPSVNSSSHWRVRALCVAQVDHEAARDDCDRSARGERSDRRQSASGGVPATVWALWQGARARAPSAHAHRRLPMYAG